MIWRLVTVCFRRIPCLGTLDNALWQGFRLDLRGRYSISSKVVPGVKQACVVVVVRLEMRRACIWRFPLFDNETVQGWIATRHRSNQKKEMFYVHCVCAVCVCVSTAAAL